MPFPIRYDIAPFLACLLLVACGGNQTSPEAPASSSAEATLDDMKEQLRSAVEKQEYEFSDELQPLGVIDVGFGRNSDGEMEDIFEACGISRNDLAEAAVLDVQYENELTRTNTPGGGVDLRQFNIPVSVRAGAEWSEEAKVRLSVSDTTVRALDVRSIKNLLEDAVDRERCSGIVSGRRYEVVTDILFGKFTAEVHNSRGQAIDGSLEALGIIEAHDGYLANSEEKARIAAASPVVIGYRYSVVYMPYPYMNVAIKGDGNSQEILIGDQTYKKADIKILAAVRKGDDGACDLDIGISLPNDLSNHVDLVKYHFVHAHGFEMEGQKPPRFDATRSGIYGITASATAIIHFRDSNEELRVEFDPSKLPGLERMPEKADAILGTVQPGKYSCRTSQDGAARAR